MMKPYTDSLSHEVQSPLERRGGKRSHNKRRRIEYRSWSDLPIDILSDVGDRLPYLDFIRFGAVCKSWEAAKDERRRSSLRLPCLFASLRYSGALQFLDLTVQRSRSVKMRPEVRNLLSQAKLHASKHGWSLLTVSDSKSKKFFFYNPFCGKVIDLPPLYMNKEKESYTTVATFTTPPISHDCVVFAVVSSTTETLVCTMSASNFGDKRWRSIHKIWLDDDDHVKDVSYIDGVFYCIIQTRYSYRYTLGTFNMALEEWNIMEDDSASLILESKTVHLVESNKELLLAVLMSSLKLPSREYTYWIVYQFNCSRKDWSIVKSLGDRALILSPCSSIASPAVGKDSEFAGMIFSYSYSMMYYISYTQRYELSEYKHLWTAYKIFTSTTFVR
ncbi:hypothetical protein ACLB2K_030946 [Fragaria x ananassa]